MPISREADILADKLQSFAFIMSVFCLPTDQTANQLHSQSYKGLSVITSKTCNYFYHEAYSENNDVAFAAFRSFRAIAICPDYAQRQRPAGNGGRKAD